MNNLVKIEPLTLKEGNIFSAPVFFDDGKNMFLAAGKSVKPYHLQALVRWKIPFLLTYGKLLTAEEIAAANEKNAGKTDSSAQKTVHNNVNNSETADDVEELEELEEI